MNRFKKCYKYVNKFSSNVHIIPFLCISISFNIGYNLLFSLLISYFTFLILEEYISMIILPIRQIKFSTVY